MSIKRRPSHTTTYTHLPSHLPLHHLPTSISPSTKSYYSAYTNVSGSEFPELSAHSDNPPYVHSLPRSFFYSTELTSNRYSIIEDGIFSPGGGISAASPAAAGMIALLNDVRLRAEKRAVGFLNPFLYTYRWQAFNVVVMASWDLLVSHYLGLALFFGRAGMLR
jgi:hypothetical protein